MASGVLTPCGHVMGVHGGLVAGIPGLKSETWGTLRVFPTRRVQTIVYGLKPQESCRSVHGPKTDAFTLSGNS